MIKNGPSKVARIMVLAVAALALRATSVQAADIEDLQRTITQTERELDNILSETKSIDLWLKKITVGLRATNPESTYSTQSSSSLLRTLAAVNDARARLDDLKKETDRMANVLASIAAAVEETGDANLINRYSNVKHQIPVVYDAIEQASLTAIDTIAVIRRLLTAQGTDGTHVYAPRTR